ncbi:MAG: hypothetical protein ACLP9S_17050 [Syntrophales bacterium]
MTIENKGKGGLGGLKDFMDSNFGKPGEAIKLLKDLSEAVASIDQAKLKEIKTMMGSMGNVQMDIEQLRLIVEIVKMLCSVDIEKVKEFRQLLVNIQQIVKLLPKDVNLKELPIGEILAGIKKE